MIKFRGFFTDFTPWWAHKAAADMYGAFQFCSSSSTFFFTCLLQEGHFLDKNYLCGKAKVFQVKGSGNIKCKLKVSKSQFLID